MKTMKKMMTLLAVFGLVLALAESVHADIITKNPVADNVIQGRSNLADKNLGANVTVTPGTLGDTAAPPYPPMHALIRFDLSDVDPSWEAEGDGTLTLVNRNHLSYSWSELNWEDGMTLDLYLLSAANSLFEEGTGTGTDVAGSSWNQISGAWKAGTPWDGGRHTNGWSKITQVVWDDAQHYLQAVSFTIPPATLNQGISQGFISFALISESAEAATDALHQVVFGSRTAGSGEKPVLEFAATAATATPGTLIIIE